MADSPQIPFTMHGARDAMAGGLGHIEEQVKSIEVAIVENPGLAFDLAKTLVESVCRSVLVERSIVYSENDDLPKLFKMASNVLPFLPPTVSDEAKARKSLAQTLNGLSTAVQGICQLRNQCGFASHGASGPRPALESIQALMAAEAADTIIGFLHRVHLQDRTTSSSPEPPNVPGLSDYNDNSEFNYEIDDTHGMIQIFQAEFRPSEVLFQMEPATYLLALAEFEADSESQDEDSDLEPTQ